MSFHWNFDFLLGDRNRRLDGPDDLLLPVEVPDDVGSLHIGDGYTRSHEREIVSDQRLGI